MLNGLWRMGDVVGRSSRQKFWLFAATLIAAYVALVILDTQLFEQQDISTYRSKQNYWGEFKSMYYSNLFRVIMALPFLSAIVRRLHDTNRSKWILILWVVAWSASLLISQETSRYLNLGFAFLHLSLTVWLFILLIQRGTSSGNTYGPADRPQQTDIFD